MELIIFDCDGVLVETEILAGNIEIEELQKIGLRISLEDYLDLGLGLHNDLVTRLLWEKFQIKLPADFWHMVADKQKNAFERELNAVKGIEDVLQSLKVPICVASSSSMERLNHTLNVTGLLRYFDGRIFSVDLVKKGKPHPDIYLYAAKYMGVRPHDCLVIEDSPTGVAGGIAAGMTVLAFAGGEHITQSIRLKLQASGAHYFFDSMRELPMIIDRIKR